MKEKGVRGRNILLGILFFVLVLSFIQLSVAQVTDEGKRGPTTPIESAISSGGDISSILQPVRDTFFSWEKGKLEISVAKYLFLALLTLVIFSILKYVPFFNSSDFKGFIKFAIALIISFLSTAYLTPSDVYTMLVSYGALGLVLGGVLPFLILFVATIEMLRDRKFREVGKPLIQIIWLAFAGVLIFKLFQGWWQNLIQGWEFLIYLALLVAAFFMIFRTRAVMKWMFKRELDDMREALYEDLKSKELVDATKLREFDLLRKQYKREGKTFSLNL